MSEPTWTSSTVEWQEGGFPEDVGDIWRRTHRTTELGHMNPVFGAGSTWYFWDETFSDALGPFESEQLAQEALKKYAENL